MSGARRFIATIKSAQMNEKRRPLSRLFCFSYFFAVISVSRASILSPTEGLGLSAVAVTLGLAISFHYDTAGGATMAGLSVLQFFIVFVAQEIRASTRRSAVPAAG